MTDKQNARTNLPLSKYIEFEKETNLFFICFSEATVPTKHFWKYF